MSDWPQPSSPIVTALPSSAAHLDTIVYEADATNGVYWLLKYNANSSSSYKWECIGGSPLMSMVDTEEGTTSATYAALTTAGPSITIPLAGDWDIEIGAHAYAQAANDYAIMSYDIGGTGAVLADGARVRASGANIPDSSISRKRRKTGLSASTALVCKYANLTGGTGHNAGFGDRWMSVRPVRVG